jgi:hypothetical protein
MTPENSDDNNVWLAVLLYLQRNRQEIRQSLLRV